MAKWIVLTGLAITLFGLLLWIAPSIPGLDRLGKLPGDIRVERENFSFYFPWVTCLLLSLLLTLVVRLFQR